MKKFQPDYSNLVAACRNKQAQRLPLYEHNISVEIMEESLQKKFSGLLYGDEAEKTQYYRHVMEFGLKNGYDCVPAEFCITDILPGGGALGNHADPVIKTREDFLRYPWDELPGLFFRKYSGMAKALAAALPPGMKAVGGVGNGIFECVQDLVGFENLCYLSFDDPDTYAEIYVKMADAQLTIWERFLKEHADAYAVLRFGDDLGYKSQTLISAKDIKEHIIPQYGRVVALAHSYGKPFLLHSCGSIFDVMDDIISVAGIDAKHSNEDVIAPFSRWVERYGNRIGLFGGIDTDHLCSKSEAEIEELVADTINITKGRCGFAIGSGNSIPEYVPLKGFMAMVNKARELRGDFANGEV